MNCFYCDYDFDVTESPDGTCPNCGADNHAYEMILRASAAAYNEGLALARIRNITGACEKLNSALKLNKYNTPARNLLGLCYFEIGEAVLAIREWVISKNLQPENNDVDRYLNEIEYGPGLLEKLDSTNKKYNMALEYCRDGSRDLVKIQLKRVLKNQPKLVKARLLLALMLMQEDDYPEARKELAQAFRIDGGNPLTLSYQNEVREVLKEKSENRKKKKPQSGIGDDSVIFRDGNDTVVMPRRTFVEALDSSKGGILNIIIGIIIGILVSIFLIVPEVRKNENTTTSTALINANESAANKETDIATLQDKVDDLTERLSAYEGKADLRTSYENLIASQQSFAAGDVEGAAVLMSSVNRDILDARGQAAYDTLMQSIGEAQAAAAYEAAEAARRNNDFAGAAAQYLIVVSFNENYADGEACYELAYCYDKTEDYSDAITYYEKYAAIHPDTRKGRNARDRANDLTKMLTAAETPVPVPEPEQSATPEQPTEPVQPQQPAEPTPAQPTTPTQPTEPTTPAQPTDPVQPQQPTEPTPAQPAEPPVENPGAPTEETAQ